MRRWRPQTEPLLRFGGGWRHGRRCRLGGIKSLINGGFRGFLGARQHRWRELGISLGWRHSINESARRHAKRNVWPAPSRDIDETILLAPARNDASKHRHLAEVAEIMVVNGCGRDRHITLFLQKRGFFYQSELKLERLNQTVCHCRVTVKSVILAKQSNFERQGFFKFSMQISKFCNSRRKQLMISPNFWNLTTKNYHAHHSLLSNMRHQSSFKG